MVDRDAVRARLARLDAQVRFLEGYRDVPRERFLVTHEVHSTVERDLQIAIECVLDVANHVVSAEGLGEPGSYREAVSLLGRAGILPTAFAERAAAMASFRNILVHGYLEVDRDVVYDLLVSGLDDFRLFAAHLRAFLDRTP